jgi:hypothetical protein
VFNIECVYLLCVINGDGCSAGIIIVGLRVRFLGGCGCGSGWGEERRGGCCHRVRERREIDGEERDKESEREEREMVTFQKGNTSQEERKEEKRSWYNVFARE